MSGGRQETGTDLTSVHNEAFALHTTTPHHWNWLNNQLTKSMTLLLPSNTLFNCRKIAVTCESNSGVVKLYLWETGGEDTNTTTIQ